MSKTETLPARNDKDGVIGLWGRVFHRTPEAYDAWLEERDMIMITAALLRLNDRQLRRIGMSRVTLALDIEDLALRAQRDAEIARDVLRIVEDETPTEQTPPHAIAAE